MSDVSPNCYLVLFFFWFLGRATIAFCLPILFFSDGTRQYVGCSLASSRLLVYRIESCNLPRLWILRNRYHRLNEHTAIRGEEGIPLVSTLDVSSPAQTQAEGRVARGGKKCVIPLYRPPRQCSRAGGMPAKLPKSLGIRKFHLGPVLFRADRLIRSSANPFSFSPSGMSVSAPRNTATRKVSRIFRRRDPATSNKTKYEHSVTFMAFLTLSLLLIERATC